MALIFSIILHTAGYHGYHGYHGYLGWLHFLATAQTPVEHGCAGLFVIGHKVL